ncbi:MAG: radical SAM protein [Synergistaceae bacterium]|nr:radical SAM protein [Synergistaceae bacterium]
MDEECVTELPRGGDLPWALFYPADYSVASSSLGYHYIYSALKELGVAAERFCNDPVPFRSIEGDTLLERFSVITASVAYEGNAEIFIRWLNSANIPLLSEDRSSESYPIIGAGGAMTYINPLLLSAVCDFIILGDALDDTLPFAVESLRRYFADGNKSKLLDQLAEHPSILVPSRHIENGSVAVKRVLANDQPLDAGYPMNSTWLTSRSSFGKTLLVELQRGCVRNCSYCTLPGCFGKIRYRDSGIIKDRLEHIFSVNEVDQVGLVTPEAGDYPHIEDLLDFLESKNKGVSFASLRIDRLTEKMLSALKRGGRHSVTVAPETGSDELRFSCGKKFTNDIILEKLQLASSLGIDQAKLYFMTGLPGETDEDIKAITELSGRIIAETGMNLILSVNPFVPKPGTTWSRMEFQGTVEIRKKYEMLVRELSNIKKKRPQLRMTSPKEAESEFLLAWYGYNESVELARNKGFSKKIRFDHDTRAKTLLELERLW